MVPRSLANREEELEGLLPNGNTVEKEELISRLCNYLKCTTEEFKLGFGGFLLSLALDGSMYSNEIFREDIQEVRKIFLLSPVYCSPLLHPFQF